LLEMWGMRMEEKRPVRACILRKVSRLRARQQWRRRRRRDGFGR